MIFRDVYDALDDFAKVSKAANSEYNRKTKNVNANYAGRLRAAAQEAAAADRDSALDSAREKARTIIQNTLNEAKADALAISGEAPVAGTADALEAAKLPDLSDHEREALFAQYGKNYFSARMLCDAIGDASFAVVTVDDVVNDLNEAQEIFRAALGSSHPNGDYLFLNCVSGNRLEEQEQEIDKFLKHDFLKVQEPENA